MAKDLIKKISIKEDYVYISDRYVDLGKVIHIYTSEREVQFCFLNGEPIAFGAPIELDASGEPHWHTLPDINILLKDEFDILLDFVKQRFGGKEII